MGGWKYCGESGVRRGRLRAWKYCRSPLRAAAWRISSAKATYAPQASTTGCASAANLEAIASVSARVRLPVLDGATCGGGGRRLSLRARYYGRGVCYEERGECGMSMRWAAAWLALEHGLYLQPLP